MKRFTALALLLSASLAVLGAYVQHRQDARAAADLAGRPVSAIGIYGCDGWLGAVIITGDGSMHPSQAVTEEQALALAKATGMLQKPGHTLHIFPLRGQCAPKAAT